MLDKFIIYNNINQTQFAGLALSLGTRASVCAVWNVALCQINGQVMLNTQISTIKNDSVLKLLILETVCPLFQAIAY